MMSSSLARNIGISGLEGRAIDLEQVAVVAVAEDIDLGDDYLIDIDGTSVGDALGLFQCEVGLALHIDDLAQGPSVVLMLDHDIFHLIDVANEAGVEVGGTDIAIDHPDAVQVPVLGVLDDMGGRAARLGLGQLRGVNRRLRLAGVVLPGILV